MAGRRSFLGTPATAPGPAGRQMLHAFGAIRRNPLEYLASVWSEFGDMVQFPIPRPPTYLVSEPGAVRRVLVGNAKSYGKSTIQYRALSLVTGEGLLVADTQAWRRQRPLVQPAFHHQTLEAIVAHVDVALQRMFAQWDDLPNGAVTDVDEAMMHAALEVVGHALFGTDLSADADRLARATLSALDVVIARARVPITPPAWLPTPANRKLERSVRQLDAAVTRMIAERRERSTDVSSDMLDLLLGSRDDSGEGLQANEIRDQLVTFIVAGHETVASALTWAWALVAGDRDVQAELQRESDSVLSGRAATIADYQRLPFARAVLDEALRLFPPAWLVTRKALDDDVLADCAVPRGSLVILSPWIVHRHPDAWPNASQFRPGRFLDGTANRSAYIPFGAGPRQCIGRDFSSVEGTLMLSAVAGRYDLRYPDAGSIPAAEPLVTIRPVGGLPLRVTRRG